MGKIILIGATKGGVGKTVSTYNLAYSLVSMGKKVANVNHFFTLLGKMFFTP